MENYDLSEESMKHLKDGKYLVHWSFPKGDFIFLDDDEKIKYYDSGEDCKMAWYPHKSEKYTFIVDGLQ